MNTSQPPAPTHTHPQPVAGCWLLAPRAETETRTRAGDYSDTCHTPPKVVGLAGGATSSPSRQRTYSQRVTSAPHFLSATGAASLRMPSTSLLEPALCLSSVARITPRLAIAGRGFSRG